MSEISKRESSFYASLAGAAYEAGDKDLSARLSSYAADVTFSNPQERQALIGERTIGIVENVQRLTQWGVEEAGKHSYLYPEGLIPRLPGEEERRGVCLYNGVRDDFDPDLLSAVYTRLGLTDARAKAQPIKMKRHINDHDEVTAFKTLTSWGVEILEIENRYKDGSVFRELWASK